MEEKNVPSWSSIAGRLLADRMWLTALELHTELVESGREEPQLREFFSNPANFERAPSFQPLSNKSNILLFQYFTLFIVYFVFLARSSSQATLDSLDLTRFSEEGDKFNDVAVLEFELRKAKETINSLRANLTQATGNFIYI